MEQNRLPKPNPITETISPVFPRRRFGSNATFGVVAPSVFSAGYDQPRTPWARVLKAQVKPFPQIQALKATLANTNPFKLSHQIDQQLDRLYSLAAQRHGASTEKIPIQQLRPNFEPDRPPSPSLRGSAWRDWTFSKKLKHQQYEKQRHMRTQPSVRFSHDSTNPSSS